MVDIFIAAMDERLNEQKYIVPDWAMPVTGCSVQNSQDHRHSRWFSLNTTDQKGTNMLRITLNENDGGQRLDKFLPKSPEGTAPLTYV